MAQDFSWLLAMHKQAQKFGDGLKPELAQLLSSPASGRGTGIIAFQPKQVSSGPAQNVSPEIVKADPDVIAFPKAVDAPDTSNEAEPADRSHLNDEASV